jgi:hypothetical protein
MLHLFLFLLACTQTPIQRGLPGLSPAATGLLPALLMPTTLANLIKKSNLFINYVLLIIYISSWEY